MRCVVNTDVLIVIVESMWSWSILMEIKKSDLIKMQYSVQESIKTNKYIRGLTCYKCDHYDVCVKLEE